MRDLIPYAFLQMCVENMDPQHGIEDDVSYSELAHNDEENFPDQHASPKLLTKVPLDTKNPARYEQNRKLRKMRDSSLQPLSSRPCPRISCPSPYYWGDYRTNSRPIHKYFCNKSPSTTGKESSTTFQTAISYFATFTKGCFILEDGVSTDAKSKKKSIQAGCRSKPELRSVKELSMKLKILNIKAGCIMWHTVKIAQKYGQRKSEKRDSKQISTIEECRRKVMRAHGLSVSWDPWLPKSTKQSGESQMEEKDVQFCWADKWQPKRLADFICNKQNARDLQFLVCQRSCPHMILEGPPGSGKSSLVTATMRELFQRYDDQIRQGNITVELKETVVKKMVVPVKATSNHIEINLNSLGGYEMNVVEFLMKELHNAKLKDKSSKSSVDYKVIVLRDADKLANDAQNYIRWLMERYQDSCKLIFCCSNMNKLQSIRSLCKVIEIAPPTNEQTIQVLSYIAENEGIALPRPFAERIAEMSDKNLRQAIRSFEACSRSGYPFLENQKIITGWEDDIAKIAKLIVDEQSPKQLYNVRGKLQKLIIHNVCPKYIFITLVEELKQRLEDNLLSELQNLYVACYDYCHDDGEPLAENPRNEARVLSVKNKAYAYVNIEAFAARCMSVYKAANVKKRCASENLNES